MSQSKILPHVLINFGVDSFKARSLDFSKTAPNVGVSLIDNLFLREMVTKLIIKIQGIDNKVANMLGLVISRLAGRALMDLLFRATEIGMGTVRTEIIATMVVLLYDYLMPAEFIIY